MQIIQDTISLFSGYYPGQQPPPWEFINNIEEIVRQRILTLGNAEDYEIDNEIAIHKSAGVEQYSVLKGPVIIGPHCFVGAGAYLRGGVHLTARVKIGPGSEIKSSVIFDQSSAAHFNYIGNSIIGSRVNFEAGSVVANHHNDRKDKRISVLYQSQIISTGAEKFGAVVGDDSKIGANAVLSPGTILSPGSIVKRLELVEQL